MRKSLALTLVTTLALVAAVAALAGNTERSGKTLTLAVYGDAPYGISPTDTSEFQATPAFIGSINADPNVSLVVHTGDIHSGKQYCTESYDRSIYALWTQFRDPLVYTPGDNEWADCNKIGEGGGAYNPATGQIAYALDPSGAPIDYAKGDPVANLDLIRSIFFAQPGQTLGGTAGPESVGDDGDSTDGEARQVFSQATAFDRAHPTDARYVENVMWEQAKTLSVTLNIPGGSNNDTDPWYKAPAQSSAQIQEVSERTGADLRWIDAAFARAKRHGIKAVMLVEQADMWDLDGKPAAHLTQYEPFVRSIASHSADFGKPVLLFNGDSHEYRSDNPLSASDPLNALHPGYDVANFHRVVVHGSTFPLEWLRLTIDPHASGSGSNAFGPFSWERIQP